MVVNNNYKLLRTTIIILRCQRPLNSKFYKKLYMLDAISLVSIWNETRSICILLIYYFHTWSAPDLKNGLYILRTQDLFWIPFKLFLFSFHIKEGIKDLTFWLINRKNLWVAEIVLTYFIVNDISLFGKTLLTSIQRKTIETNFAECPF